jgi:hypothetical protein
METFVPMLATAALIYAASNLLKLVVAGELASAGTQVASWVIGIGAVFLLQASDFAPAIAVGDQWSLDGLNAWSTALVGLSLAGVGNFAYDVSPLSTPTIGAPKS